MKRAAQPEIVDAQERFLRAIAERIPPERVVEVHLFGVLRQGGSESRVAVIAAMPETVPDVPDDSYLETDEPLTSAEERPAMEEAELLKAPARLTIYQAHYRLVLKGPDRGTWEVDVTAEADAPIETVDEVVRGVHRRAGDEAEPERLTGHAFRAALSDEPWTAAR
jgi:hypothetical protein